MKSLKGTGVALVTPFKTTGEVDYDGLTKLLNHTAAEVDYLVVHGTTGESATTTADEKNKILRHIIDHNSSKLPIIYGIGGNNTMGVITTIKDTNFVGIDAILSVSPYYNKPTQEGIIAHFTKIADECPVPVILYNVPSRTSTNLEASTTIELAKHPNIIGIKEASGNVEQSIEIVKNTPEDFMLISGDDMLTPTLMSVGAIGVISVLANVFPQVFSATMALAFEEKFEKATATLQQLSSINPLMYEESNPVGLKEALYQMGICNNTVRLPLLPASTRLSQKIKTIIA